MAGGGVVLFSRSKILGGDAGYYYTGTYTNVGETFSATLIVTPFLVGHMSVFGTANRIVVLRLSGLVQADQATAQGHPEGMLSLSFGAKLTRRLAIEDVF